MRALLSQWRLLGEQLAARSGRAFEDLVVESALRALGAGVVIYSIMAVIAAVSP